MTIHSRLFFALTVLSIVLRASWSFAEESLAADVTQRIDAAMRAEMERQHVVGLAIGVIRNGRVAYVQGYGLADRDAQRPVTRDTMFRWASVSKPLTAVATMQLVEAGKLKLDDDVRQYVPEFPDQGQRITVRHLLCHQSGIVHYFNGPVLRTERTYDDPHPFANVVTSLDNFNQSPLVAAPGETYSYTTHGYMLLAAVVERAGGQPFAEQVHDRIAKPLGLRTLQPDYQWIDIPNRTKGYRWLPGIVVNSSDTDVSWKLGGGGFISNVGDMARFAAAIAQGRLLKPETWQAVSTPQRTNSGEATDYGFGFDVSGAGKSLKLSHNGGQEKTSTRLVVYPRRKSGVVVMCNTEFANAGKFSTLVYAVLKP